MTAKEIEAGEPLETTSTPPTRDGNFKRHCARRWWVWLVSILFSLVVLIIIILFAIVPAVAQKTLDKTSSEVNSISILDPTPDHFSISLVSHITGGGSIASHAKLDPMDVNFSLNGNAPFLTVPFPGVQGGNDILIEKINYTASIQNPDGFLQFAKTLIDSEAFTMGVNGNTKLRMGSLKTNVKYRESITLKGLNKLQGMEITEYTLVSNQTDHNLRGKVVLPNPSVFTIQTGDVSLKIDFNGTSLGSGVLPGLILTPGLDNKYDFRALLDTEKLTKAMLTFLSGNAVLQISADRAVVNNVNIPWLSIPLGSLAANVSVRAPAPT